MAKRGVAMRGRTLVGVVLAAFVLVALSAVLTWLLTIRRMESLYQ